MDPISLIPMVLNGIQTLYNIIREVKVNKKKCQRLGERIETICETLKPLQEPTFISTNIQITLNRFCNFIDECTDFVRKFVDVPLYKRIYARRTYNDEFERYERELSNYNNHLQLDIQIAMKDNVKKIIDTTLETQNAIDVYTLHLAEQSNAVAQTQNAIDVYTLHLAEQINAVAQTQNAIDVYTLHLAEQINAVAQTQSATTETMTSLSNRMDVTTTTLNELREDLSNFAQIIHSYGPQLKQNIEVHQQILTQIAEKNKKHSGIFRCVKRNH